MTTRPDVQLAPKEARMNEVNRAAKTDEQRAQVIYLDATTLATSISSALRNLSTGKAGYASGHEGSGGEASSTTERLALNKPGQAEVDARELDRQMRAAETAIRAAAVIAQRWATWNIDGQTRTKERLVAADQGIWCTNCGPMGYKNPKAPSHTECEFCADFRAQRKRPCPKDVLDLRAAKGRIYVQDIDRILRRIDTEAKAAKKAAQAKAKAEKNADAA